MFLVAGERGFEERQAQVETSGAYKSATVRTLFESAPPTTTREGSLKSRTAEPSRRNSGLETTDTDGCPASKGTTTSSQVPGKTVLRMATISGLDRPARRAWMFSTTRRSCSRLMLPFFSEGVPTVINVTSARERASAK